MRITNNMLVSQQMYGTQLNMAAMNKAQEQLTSGKRINVASDDPTGATTVMKANSSLAALAQYKTNVSQASSRLATEDGVLSQLNDLLARVKELAVGQASATATDATRSSANAEVSEIFKEIVSLGNTQFGNEYLFGGDQSTTAPLQSVGSGATLDYTSTNPSGQRAVTIGDGQTVTTTHTATQLFQGTGVLDAVRDLSRSLDPASASYGQSGITSAMTSLDKALDSVQTMVGETGARANTLNSASQNLDSLKTTVSSFKSDVQDVDLESAMTELTSRQLAYQAALVATSKVTSLNLTDYLR